MKKIIYSLLVAAICTTAMAQDKDKDEKNDKKVIPPNEVVVAFMKDNPTINKVSWGLEDGNYEAEYKIDGNEQSTTYDKSGNRLEVETEIKTDELPQAIKDYVKKNYVGYKLTEASKIVNSNGLGTYEVEVSKGKEKIDLIFDVSGNFLKAEKVIED